ncbi:MAG: 2-C-methyl-D-erythritol 2,4-cyclodiphosphate synthase [Chloroflexota bacterium]
MNPSMMRVGTGYDCHMLVTGRKLVLAGVEVPFQRGLEGWSDGDAATHAVIDALCGAADLGDIGSLFPDADERYRNVSSLRLLEEVGEMVREKGMQVGNVDLTILADRPAVSTFFPQMRAALAEALHVDDHQVTVKAATGNKLGFVGRGEGIAAQAVALVLVTY